MIDIKPGKYVVAVSGGVDSIVLLDLVSKIKDSKFVVAHFDHSMREGSEEDAEFVEDLVKNKYKLEFSVGKARTGDIKSEDQARFARYEMLNTVRELYKYDKVITAHHYDDVIETIIINLLRGTSYLGSTTLKDSPLLVRPLLDWSKDDIKKYALQNKLEWREDKSNQDTKFLRNYIRHEIIPLAMKRDPDFKKKLFKIRESNQKLGEQIESDLKVINRDVISDEDGTLKIDRSKYIMLPRAVALELLADVLRGDLEEGSNISKDSLRKLNLFIKTSKNNTKMPFSKTLEVVSFNEHVFLWKRNISLNRDENV